jgi:hypothetical protein
MSKARRLILCTKKSKKDSEWRGESSAGVKRRKNARRVMLSRLNGKKRNV